MTLDANALPSVGREAAVFNRIEPRPPIRITLIHEMTTSS